VENPTQLLHRLTSYEPGREWDVPIDDPRIVNDAPFSNVEHIPWFFKRYNADLPMISLPRTLPTTAASAIDVLNGTAEVSPTTLTLDELSRLLHLSAGVVRTMERPYGTYLFRAAGSAGGRFPLELYVAVPAGHDLAAGVYWYHPSDHALVRIGEAPLTTSFGTSPVGATPRGPTPLGGSPTVVVTGVPWRTGWRYRERGYRHIFWDAGTMLAQMCAVADSAGLGAQLYTDFPDAEVAALVGADGVHEFPVALISFGDGPPIMRAGGPTIAGDIDANPIEFPLITSAQQAGDIGELGTSINRGPIIHTRTEHLESKATMEAVVLRKGSQRAMDPSRTLPKHTLQTCMEVAVRGISLTNYVVVHGVDGVKPGLYRWPNLDAPLRCESMRDEMYIVSLEQGLTRDAAFVVITTTFVNELSDREYRNAQLLSGIVEGRLHLAAYALGASASGMTFNDRLIPSLLARNEDAMLFTCVGVPNYKSAIGGPPGQPTATRRVSERL
jgi:SagB-type dehydrogenase family enzyme